jgi:hypothetical protein
MNRDLIQHIKNHFQPGVRIRLISMLREPQMPEGLKGTVSGVDDAGQILTHWENGSSLALVPEIDKFVAYNGPTAEEYLRPSIRKRNRSRNAAPNAVVISWNMEPPSSMTVPVSAIHGTAVAAARKALKTALSRSTVILSPAS